MPTALITGGAKGIGRASARSLAQAGYKVWIGDRDAALGAETAAALRGEGLDVAFVPLDVTDTEAIQAAVETVGADTPILDALINNAGVCLENTDTIGVMTPPSELRGAVLRATYDVHFFGPVAMIRAFLPLISRSLAGRIVNVTAALGSFGRTLSPEFRFNTLNALGYKSSKAALNMATVNFALELRDRGIKVNAISPGLIATDLSGPGWAEKLKGREGFLPPEEAARIVVEFATLPDDGPTGEFHSLGLGQIPW